MLIKTKPLSEKEAKVELDNQIKDLQNKGAFIRRKQKKLDYKTGNIYYEIDYYIKPKYD